MYFGNVNIGTKRTEYVINSQPELSQVLQSKTIKNNNEESAEITYYYYGKGLLAQENSKGYLVYHFNNVGSTMAVTDKDGKITTKYNYSPYGERIEGEYDENIQFLYNGQYGVTTDGNGLYYMRARYYNVDIKRFINQDVLTGTLERISSLNRYSYVEGNPVSYLDPFGLEKQLFNELMDDLHEGIANAQLVVLLAQIVVSAVATIAASSGNLAITAYASYYFVVLYKFSNFLTALDSILYVIDVFNPNNDGDKVKDIVNGAINIVSLFGPFKEILSGESKGFGNWEKVEQLIKSLEGILKGEFVNVVMDTKIDAR